ncbi:MAG: type 2 isopentenyl-diphosphate Delta-isomerase [Saprospiraceae bacterium]|nr:type 2 isopentenyl-diphosphate Delta-isomerase [Saprospiraceae bacterium]
MNKEDPSAASRKKDHIELAFESQTALADDRFFYEPLMTGNKPTIEKLGIDFLGYTFKAPIWVSSMTGGTGKAGQINRNLARMCKEFSLGMGLGSCRSLLYDDKYLSDFSLRSEIGDRPLYANLGIAQVEQLLKAGQVHKITELVKKLEANGLIVYINPLQAWFQPEGDRYTDAPLLTISRLLEETGLGIMVKEVGHGMGPESIKSLMKMPLHAIEFAAFGGTNFSKLELLRDTAGVSQEKAAMAHVGHTALEMVGFVNEFLELDDIRCQQIIISGGIKTFLDGYYLTSVCKANCIYGQASGFLKHATGDYETLQAYATSQMEGLSMASQFLRIKKPISF